MTHTLRWLAEELDEARRAINRSIAAGNADIDVSDAHQKIAVALLICKWQMLSDKEKDQLLVKMKASDKED